MSRFKFPASLAATRILAMALCGLACTLPAVAADSTGQAAWQRPVRNPALSQQQQPTAASGGLQGPNSRYHEAMPGNPQGSTGTRGKVADGNAWAGGAGQPAQSSRAAQPGRWQRQTGSVSRHSHGAGSCGNCGSTGGGKQTLPPTTGTYQLRHPIPQKRAAVKPPANGRTIDPNIGK